MLGPGNIRLMANIPRSTPSANTHWQWLHSELVAFGVHTWQALREQKKKFGVRTIETGRLSCPAKRHVENDIRYNIMVGCMGVCVRVCILTLQVRCKVLRWSDSNISSAVLPRGKLSRIPRATTVVGSCAIRLDLSCQSPTTSNLMAVGWCVTLRKCLRKTSKTFFFFLPNLHAFCMGHKMCSKSTKTMDS